MSDTPALDRSGPQVVELKPGIYSWCTCGYSQKGALCDGSHMGKGACPETFIVETNCKRALCQCLKTETRPYCDGSHNRR